MSTPIQLYGKPQMGLNPPVPPLSITGVLDGYVPGEAYTGYLQINNSVGFCSLQRLEGTVLPADCKISIDSSKRIVFSWNPAAIPETSVVPDGDFEASDGWVWMNGWRWITGYDHLSGIHSAGFADFKGNSWLQSTATVPCVPNTTINAKVSVQQGGSSAGNVRAGVALQWLDAQGQVIKADVGNIVTSGSDGEWHDSNLSATSPLGTAFVKPLVFGSRKKQNALLYVDDFTWDHKYAPGAQSDDDYPIFLKVTDSLGRVAYWQGTLSQIVLQFTSLLYPADPILDQFNFTGPRNLVFTTRQPPAPQFTQDFINFTGPRGLSFSTTVTVAYKSFIAPQEKIVFTGPRGLAFSTTVTVAYKSFTAPQEKIVFTGPRGLSFSTTVTTHYVNYAMAQERIVFTGPRNLVFTTTKA